MAKQRDVEPLVSFTRPQLAILGASLAAVAALLFAVGYLAGSLAGERPPLVEEARPAMKDPYLPPSTKLLDPEKVAQETMVAEEEAPAPLTFHDRLTENAPPPKPQTAPAPVPPSALAAKPAQPPAVAAPAAAPEPKPAATPAPAAKPAPSPKTAAVTPSAPAAPSGKRLTLQVAAFSSREEANQLVLSLARGKYPAYVVPFPRQGKTWYRVRVGMYGSPDQANQVAQKLKTERGMAALVTAYER
ncbi:MAG: SPOR domain-containing protein [Nitrospinae bacterium]|nr:SPOR domain-containing protein [Nitrospinota bacterium]